MNRPLRCLIAALAFSGALVSGTAAQPLGDAYATTQTIFGAAPSQVLAEVEGRWLPLSQLAGGIEAPADRALVSAMMERFCKASPLQIEITSRSKTAITITTSKADISLAENYDWVEGSSFAYSADPDALTMFLGLKGAPAKTKSSAIAARPSRVGLYRTAPDLLVLVPDRGQTSIYGRCP